MNESDYTYVPMRKDLFLGQYVRSNRHGHVGRVTGKHLRCPQSPEWIAMQAIPLTPAEINEPWVDILVHNPDGGAGAVIVPQSSIEVIDRFIFKHRDRDDYFPADDEDDLIDAQTQAVMEPMEYELTVKVTTEYRFRTEVGDFNALRGTIADIWNRQPGINQFGGPVPVGAAEVVELINWDRVK